MPLLVAFAVFLFALHIWPVADWSPILFALVRPTRTAGLVTAVELSQRRPSDGSVWEVRFSYATPDGMTREGISWAPTTDSKRAIFWTPFPRPIVGSTVEIEEWPLIGVVRIKAMRTGWCALDGALWLVLVDAVVIIAGAMGSRRSWRGNRLLASGTLGQARLERMEEVRRGRSRIYRLHYRLMEPAVGFNFDTFRRDGLDVGKWEWCLYEARCPQKAVLLVELPALPDWARSVRDTPLTI